MIEDKNIREKLKSLRIEAFDKIDEVVNELTSHIEELQEDIDKLKEENEELQSEVRDLQFDIENLKQENETLKNNQSDSN